MVLGENKNNASSKFRGEGGGGKETKSIMVFP